MPNLKKKTVLAQPKGKTKIPQNSNFLYSTVTRYIAWILNCKLPKIKESPF